MPLKLAGNEKSLSSSREYRANCSASFVLTSSNGLSLQHQQFGLDTCPKCGQNVCEHASLADVIHLPNSVSQDFSTYSSDSSLIKQLFSDQSTQSNATIESIDLNTLDMDELNRLKLARFLRLKNKSSGGSRSIVAVRANHHRADGQLRPVSCQVMLIDPETTDKLLKEFYEAAKPSINEQTILNDTEQEENKETDLSPPHQDTTMIEKKEKGKKKTKFPNFRLFMTRRDNATSSSSSSSSSSSHHHHRHHLLVNCLTSSGSSSSSCEDVTPKFNTIIKKNKKPSSVEQSNETPKSKTSSSGSESSKTVTSSLESSTSSSSNQQTPINEPNDMIGHPIINFRHNIRKSIISIDSNGPQQHQQFDHDLNSYNEVHTLELCPIVGPNDIDDDYYAYEQIAQIINNQQKNVNDRRSSLFLLTRASNVAKKEEPQPTRSSSEASLKNVETYNDYEESHIISTDMVNITCNKLDKILLVEQNSTELNKKPHSPPPGYTENLKKTVCDHNRFSFFSNCSSCDNKGEEESRKMTRGQHNNNKPEKSTTKSSSVVSGGVESILSPIKYHSVSIIFILMGLFTLNFLQESLLMLYYFSTENQFYWFIYGMIALFTGQILTLILTLLTEIDLVNVSSLLFYGRATQSNPKTVATADQDHRNNKKCRNKDGSSAITNTTSTSLSESSSRQNAPLLYKPGQNEPDQISSSSSSTLINEPDRDYLLTNYNTELYKIFKSPFSKLMLLVPGYLPVAVYIQFFCLLFNYRQSCSLARFKAEFQLAYHMFLNSLFHSLPLAILNSCYLASIVKSSKSFIAWYSTSFLSTLSTREFFSTISTSLNNAFSKKMLTGSTSSTQLYMESANKSQFLYFLVSVFVSISVGICLYTAYFELMKQIHFMSLFRSTKTPPSTEKNEQDARGLLVLNRKRPRRRSMSNLDENSLNNLGLVELIVYFCYKFCLITSRLAVLALFWYMFSEWVLLAGSVHILVCYLSTSCSQSTLDSATRAKLISVFFTQKLATEYKSLFDRQKSNNSHRRHDESSIYIENGGSSSTSSLSSIMLTSSSKINQHLSLFIVSLLSLIELFSNQLSEFYNLKRCIVYYVVCFVQNLTVLTYWLVKTTQTARREQEKTGGQPSHNKLLNLLFRTSTDVYDDESSKSETLRAIVNNGGSSIIDNPQSPTVYACYATLIYLCIILFTIFGLILKFLHMHIVRKRYKKLCDEILV